MKEDIWVGVVVFVCNPSTREAEAGVSKVQGHLGYCVSLRSGQAVWGDPVLKKKS